MKFQNQYEGGFEPNEAKGLGGILKNIFGTGGWDYTGEGDIDKRLKEARLKDFEAKSAGTGYYSKSPKKFYEITDEYGQDRLIRFNPGTNKWEEIQYPWEKESDTTSEIPEEPQNEGMGMGDILKKILIFQLLGQRGNNQTQTRKKDWWNQ